MINIIELEKQVFMVLKLIKVCEGRINGNLNLSRAIGDLEYKKIYKLSVRIK